MFGSQTQKALKQLAKSDEGQQQQGLHMLLNQARSDAAKLLRKHPECVPALVGVLCSSSSSPKVQTLAAEVVVELARWSEARDRVGAAPDAVGGLVALLGSQDTSVQREAVAALRSLTSDHPANKNRIGAAPGAVGGLVALLGSWDTSVQREAAAALRNLTLNHPTNQDRVGAAPGAVGGLVALLGSQTATVQEHAAAALRNLTLNHPANQDRIGAAPGAVGALVALLGSQNASVQREAVTALRNLTLNHPANQDRIGEAPGAVGALVALLGSQTATVQEHAAAALSNLAYNHPANQDRIGAAPGAVGALVALLGSQTATVQEHAAAALSNLAYNHPANQYRIGAAPGAVGGLVVLLGSQNVTVQQEAVAALSTLAYNHPANQDRIGAAPGAVDALVALLGSADEVVQEQAAGALWALADIHLANQQRIGQMPTAIPRLAGLLNSSNAVVRYSSACAFANLCSLCKDNAVRILQCKAATDGLVRLLHAPDSEWADLEGSLPLACVKAVPAAALVFVAAGDPVSDGAAGRQLLQQNAAAVWAALPGVLLPEYELQPQKRRLLAEALQSLASSSPRLQQSMQGSVEIQQLLQQSMQVSVEIQQLLQEVPDTSNGLLHSVHAHTYTHSTFSPHPLHIAASSTLNAAAGLMGPWGGSGPKGKLATTVELLGALQAVSKDIPFLEPVVSAIKGVLDAVEQVRVNKAKARSLASRVQALLGYLVCITGPDGLLQQVVSDQQDVLEAFCSRLIKALKDALDLVSKWRKTMSLKVAVRFLKKNLDKDDIKDIRDAINAAVMDLNNVVSSLNLAQTLVMRQEQKQQAAAFAAQVASSGTPLEEAHQQDLDALRGHLELLVGGQQALAQQLEEASQKLRADWYDASAVLDQVASDVADMRQQMNYVQQDVQQLVTDMKALRAQAGRGSSSSSGGSSSKGCIVRSRLILDRADVDWLESGPPLDRGGFASVFEGSYDGHRVAVKQLDMAAFVAEDADEMYYEAAVLGRLNHPNIVHFYGLVVDTVAPATNSKTGFHDSGSSLTGSRAKLLRDDNVRDQFAGCAGPPAKLRVGLVLECCDLSLQSLLDGEPLLPLSAVLIIGVGIAGGLKYLHSDSHLQVVHGDLKPANVLIRGQDIKLADFGLSRTIAIHSSTMAGHILMKHGAGTSGGGTLLWAAPELLEAWAQSRDAPCTLATDMYACGLILYQLLTGRLPYQGMYSSEESFKCLVRSGKRPEWGDDWLEKRTASNGQGASEAAEVLAALQRLTEQCWAHEGGQRPTAKQVHAQLLQLRK